MATSTTDHEFTFPIVTDSYSCSIDSPPLWRLSPAASPDSTMRKNNQEEELGDYCFTGKPSKCKCRQTKSCSDYEGDEEDKMDILWEDFNEELSSSSSRLNSSKKSSSGDMVELGCSSQALKLSRSTGGANAIFSTRKPAFVVFIKVLKKFFLIHSSHHRSSVKNKAMDVIKVP